MSVQRFNDNLIGEALTLGWSVMKRHQLFSSLLLVVFVCNFYFVNSIIPRYFPGSSTAHFMVAFIGLLISIPLMKTSLLLFDMQKPKITDIISAAMLIKYLTFFCLLSFILAIGLILLIIPGIIWALRLLPASYLIIDLGLGPIQAIKRSWLITKNYTWTLFLLCLPIIGIGHLANYLLIKFGILSLAGLLVLIVLFVVFPVWQFAMVSIYRKLNAQPPLGNILTTDGQRKL